MPGSPVKLSKKVQFMRSLQVLVPIAAALGVFGAPAHAQMACAASAGVVRLTNAQVSALLTGRTVCGVPGAGYSGSPSDRWQEEHLANGDLFDYKRGPGHPVDPREKVGTWAVRTGFLGPQGVSHRYASATFNWDVYGPAANTPGISVYSFCVGIVEHVRAHVIPTASGCAAYPSGSSPTTKLVPQLSTPRTPAAVTAR